MAIEAEGFAASADEVAHLFALGLEIALVVGALRGLRRRWLDDLDSGEFESLDLGGVVGGETDGGDAHLLENLGGKLEVAAVGFVVAVALRGVRCGRKVSQRSSLR
jgi:small ligand-binding sensory domain FIST